MSLSKLFEPFGEMVKIRNFAVDYRDSSYNPYHRGMQTLDTGNNSTDSILDAIKSEIAKTAIQSIVL